MRILKARIVLEREVQMTSQPWINLATPISNYSAIDNNMKRTNFMDTFYRYNIATCSMIF